MITPSLNQYLIVKRLYDNLDFSILFTKLPHVAEHVSIGCKKKLDLAYIFI